MGRILVLRQRVIQETRHRCLWSVCKSSRKNGRAEVREWSSKSRNQECVRDSRRKRGVSWGRQHDPSCSAEMERQQGNTVQPPHSGPYPKAPGRLHGSCGAATPPEAQKAGEAPAHRVPCPAGHHKRFRPHRLDRRLGSCRYDRASANERVRSMEQ